MLDSSSNAGGGKTMQSENQNNNSSSDENQTKAAATSNVWIVTLPFFSHVVCAAQLGELIAKHGLSVTLFAATADIRRLQTSRNGMLENWKRQRLDIKLQPLEINSVVLADSVGDGGRFLDPYSQAGHAFEYILKSELDRGSKPTCVISDFALPAILVVAAQFKIPGWSFLTLSLGYAAAYIYVKQLESKGILTLPHSCLDKKAQEEIISLPGLPLMRLCDLSPLYFKDDPLHNLGCEFLEPLLNADVILLSGFRELEPRGFQDLKKLLKAYSSKNFKEMPHIWPIGPTFPFLSYSKHSEVKSTGDSEVHPCIKFLDSQPPCSVVYVAFGTDVNLSREQIQELVYGLESSQQPFLCALHPPKNASTSDVQIGDIWSILPPDCLERIKGRSLFVRWAPQMEVLSHPSTGAFISHCGFNSLLESVSLGVPILAWPFQFEQFTNCRLLVDEAQIASEVCPSLVRGGFVARKTVENSINTLFHSDEGAAIRERALQMKQRAERTVAENGSSMKNMEALVARIKNLTTLKV